MISWVAPVNVCDYVTHQRLSIFPQVSRVHTRAVVFASTMSKMDSETLVKYATQTEKALTDKTLSAISNLSPDVVLHQDAFTLQHDIKGEAEVKKYLQTYFDKYEYEHDTLGYAVNPDSSCSFALSYDKVQAGLQILHAWGQHSSPPIMAGSDFCLARAQMFRFLLIEYVCMCMYACMQGVHLKNKGDLPEEALKPVPTVGMPCKLTGLLFCFANLQLASMAVDSTRCAVQLLHTVSISKNSISCILYHGCAKIA